MHAYVESDGLPMVVDGKGVGADGTRCSQRDEHTIVIGEAVQPQAAVVLSDDLAAVRLAAGKLMGAGELMAVNMHDGFRFGTVSLFPCYYEFLRVLPETLSAMPLIRRSSRSQLPAKCHWRPTMPVQLYARLPGRQTRRSARRRRTFDPSRPRRLRNAVTRH
jgi:hypothetical protein